MTLGISGFRLRCTKRVDIGNTSVALPSPFADSAARDTVIEKIRSMGEAFFQMPENEYRDWLNALPKNEFIELIALNSENNLTA